MQAWGQRRGACRGPEIEHATLRCPRALRHRRRPLTAQRVVREVGEAVHSLGEGAGAEVALAELADVEEALGGSFPCEGAALGGGHGVGVVVERVVEVGGELLGGPAEEGMEGGGRGPG